MLNSVLKGVLLFLTLILTSSLVVHAEENDQEQGQSEGTVVYHVKYNYDEISNFLGMSREAYEKEWKAGLSIADMAKKQGISRRDLEGYFYSFHYNEMQKWRVKGVLSEKHYFHLVYTLADEIEEFIDRNPNR